LLAPFLFSRPRITQLTTSSTAFVSTEDQKQKDAQELFDFCAECLNNFITDHFANDDGEVDLAEPLALGFTFSYPCLQEKIDHGILIRWTKGFGAPGAEGKDCAAMFQQSLDKFVSPSTIRLIS
jgi:hexokinase